MIEIKRLGKNLWQPNFYRYTGSTAWEPYKDGIHYWGSTSDGIYVSDIFLSPGTYTISAKALHETTGIAGWSIFKKTPYTQIVRTSMNSKTNPYRTFTITEPGIYRIGFEFYHEDTEPNKSIYIWDIQLEENDTVSEYEGPNIKNVSFDYELYGFEGIYDFIDGEKIVKKWQRTTKTTDASGNFTLSGYKGGTKVIVVNNDNGETKTYDAASTITTSWANAEVTVIYCQSSPTLIELPEHGLKTSDDVNYFDVASSVKDTYIGDGTTTTFTLSQTADNTYYQVYVNGEIDNSVSKTTTQFTFSEPPKNGALIEVYYNRYYLPTPMSVEVFEPSGTVEQLTFFTNLSINIQQNVRQVRDVFGDVEVKKLNETYQVRLDRNILENIDDFYQQYKDKTFRLKIENSSTGEAEYLTPCKIVNASKDYFGRLESITIMALDYYKA